LTATAQKNRHAKFEFELFDATGKAWLGDVTPLCCAPEVAFFRHGDEVAKLPDEHAAELAIFDGGGATAS
jgi:hypothetical protein